MSKDVAPTLAAAGRATTHRHAGALQFLRFCVVGVSSTAVDIGLMALLLKLFTGAFAAGPLSAAMPQVQAMLCAALSFTAGVTNGFFWNRRWTFRQTAGRRSQQYGKFYAVNVVGLVLTLGIIKLVYPFVPHALVSLLPSSLDNPRGIVSKLAAASIVVFWNYLANKHWTFAD